MEDITDTETGLLNKTQDELTVKDSIKLQLYGIVAVGAIYATVVGGAVGYNALSDWRNRKKEAKAESLQIVDTTATEKKED